MQQIDLPSTNALDHYLKYLSFLCLDKIKEKWTENYMACNSGSLLAFANRVYVPGFIDESDFEEMKSFFGDLPFTLWVDKSNNAAHEILEKKVGLKIETSYPLMKMNIGKLKPFLFSDSVKVKKITSKDEILSVWAPLIARVYNIFPVSKMEQFVLYLLSTAQHNNIYFYIGYCNNEPCATSMLIERGNVVDIHWVGTVQEYRNRGVGYAVSYVPLIDTSASEAILYASGLGKSVYEKIGFRTISEADVFKYIPAQIL